MGNALGWIALIVGVAALVWLTVVTILYFQDRNVFKFSSSWTVTQGTSTVTAYTAVGNGVYVVPTGATALTINKPDGDISGRAFIVDNLANANAMTLTGGSGITITGASLGSGTSGMYIWTSNTAIQRAM